MPSINEVLERTTCARPDGIEDAVKAAWLLELDGRLLREVVREHEGDEPDETALPVRWPEDADKPLLVRPPYDNLYDLYIYAQGDALNREYSHYANSAVLFEAALDEWKKQYHRTHRPKSAGDYRNLF